MNTRATPEPVVPTPSPDIAGLVGLPWRELDGDIYDAEDRIIAVTVDGGNDGNATLIVNAVNAVHGSTEPVAELVRRLLLIADDPMWADHAEISKALLRLTATALQRVAQERDAARETNRKLNRLNQKYEHAFTFGLQTLDEKAIGGQRFMSDAKLFLQAWHMYRDARDRAEAAEARIATARDEGLEAIEAMNEALHFITDIDNSHRSARKLRKALALLKGQPK